MGKFKTWIIGEMREERESTPAEDDGASLTG
jgi:hypothetical protein